MCLHKLHAGSLQFTPAEAEGPYDTHSSKYETCGALKPHRCPASAVPAVRGDHSPTLTGVSEYMPRIIGNRTSLQTATSGAQSRPTAHVQPGVIDCKEDVTKIDPDARCSPLSWAASTRFSSQRPGICYAPAFACLAQLEASPL